MYTSNIKTTDDSLERIGGKGRSLARMTCAGFDVPGGFRRLSVRCLAEIWKDKQKYAFPSGICDRKRAVDNNNNK